VLTAPADARRSPGRWAEKLSSIKFFELNADSTSYRGLLRRNRFLEQAVINQNRWRRFFSYIAVFVSSDARVMQRACSHPGPPGGGEREHAATLLWRHLLGSSRSGRASNSRRKPGPPRRVHSNEGGPPRPLLEDPSSSSSSTPMS